VSGRGAQADALVELDEITRRLRRECPWDREQDERSIVPHTVEEAYELADAAESRDDAKLVDELGDVLFQVMFLSLLLEERGAGDLAAVAQGCRDKLIRRHPHVFRDVDAPDARSVLRNWDDIKRGEKGREGSLFGDLPENLPATLYARKVLRRVESAGRETALEEAAGRLSGEAERLGAAQDRDERFGAAGDLLLAAVAAARAAGVDPELALRGAAARLGAEVEGARA